MHITYSNSTYSTRGRAKGISGNTLFVLSVAIACAIYLFSATTNSEPTASFKCQSDQSAIDQQYILSNND